jgi:hypothetical protein
MERTKFFADSIPKPLLKGTPFYKMAKAIVDDMPDLTDEERKELTITLSYYQAKKD